MAGKPLVSKSEWKVFFLAALILSVLGGGISAMVAIFTRPPEAQTILPRENPFRDTGALGISQDMLLSDFQFGEEKGTVGQRTWLFSREVPNWSLEKIQDYWQDPQKFKVIQLPKANDNLINEMLLGETDE